MDAKRLDHACAKVGACPAIRTPLLTGQLRPVIAGTDTANKVVTLYREHQRAKADCEQRGYDTSAFEVDEPEFEAADDIQQPDDAQMQENLVKQGKFTAGAMFYAIGARALNEPEVLDAMQPNITREAEAATKKKERLEEKTKKMQDRARAAMKILRGFETGTRNYKKGDSVEVLWEAEAEEGGGEEGGEEGDWWPAKITGAGGEEGTYNVQYETDEKETERDVPAAKIRVLNASPLGLDAAIGKMRMDDIKALVQHALWGTKGGYTKHTKTRAAAETKLRELKEGARFKALYRAVAAGE